MCDTRHAISLLCDRAMTTNKELRDGAKIGGRKDGQDGAQIGATETKTGRRDAHHFSGRDGGLGQNRPWPGGMHSHHGRPSEQKTAAPEEQGEQGDPGWGKMEAGPTLQGQTRRTEGQAELGQTAMGGQGRAPGECRELRRLDAQGKEPGSLDQEVALVINGGDPVRGRLGRGS
jgi:hypothetical protein